jgi:hypothetical protein
MNFAIEGMRTIRRVVSEKLGVCPFCMRASARGALVAWSVYWLGRALDHQAAVPAAAWALLLAGAWAFTLLIVAHLIAYMARRASRIRAIERSIAHDRHRGRVLTRREFVSLVLGAGAMAAAIAVFGHVPAQGGIVNCPGKFDMNREASGFGGTNRDAEDDFHDLVDAICDTLCSTKICTSGGCVRNSNVPRVHTEKKYGPSGAHRTCTATIKQCSCSCSVCTAPHSLNRWAGQDYAGGVDITEGIAAGKMMEDARKKCDQECGRYRDCHPNPPLNCKRNGDPEMDPNTYKADPGPGIVWVYQRVKNCRCSCQDAPPGPLLPEAGDSSATRRGD